MATTVRPNVRYTKMMHNEICNCFLIHFLLKKMHADTFSHTWCLCCVHATNDKRQPANDTSYMVLWVPERLATQSYTSAKDVHMTTSILLKNIQTFCTFLCLAWITCSSVWLVHLYPPHRDLIFRIYKSKPSASIHYIRRYIYYFIDDWNCVNMNMMMTTRARQLPPLTLYTSP